MKITAFFLFLAISGFSQSVSTNFIPIQGTGIKGIVSDEPAQEFDFVYDNSGAIYQYRNNVLLEVFQLEDEIFHLYVSSDGFMYVTLDSTDRLLIVDYTLKEPVHEIDKEYAVQFANEKYVIASYRSSDYAVDNTYRYGLVALDRKTWNLIPDHSMPYTSIYDKDNEILLINEVEDWGKPNAMSNIYTLDTRTLHKSLITQMKDVAPRSSISQSSDNRYVLYLNGSVMSVFDTDRKLVSKKLPSEKRIQNCGFINQDNVYVRSNGELEIINLTSMSSLKYEMDGEFKNTKVLFHTNKAYVIAYSQKSNIVQKFQF